MRPHEKYLHLITDLKNLGAVAVAFSGGVDSTFLLAAAKSALNDKILALTMITPYIAQWEIEEAKSFTTQHHINHLLLEMPIIESIKNNPPERCYLCKKAIFTQFIAAAKQIGYSYIIDGTNYDDLKDYRPGFQALKELHIKSPLLENQLTKADIRQLSQQMNLPTWDKPAYACLLTRIPHHTPIQLDTLLKIEQAEKYLIQLGFKAVRVRCHDDLARIEIDKREQHKFLEEATTQPIVETLKSFGFNYITLDIQGYKMGSLNQNMLDLE